MQKIYLNLVLLSVLLNPLLLRAQDGDIYTIKSTFAATETCNYKTKGIFIAWWDNRWDYGDQADELLSTLEAVRNDCLNNFHMADPPNPVAGFFYNVYIHNGVPDLFPDGWAMGQGTDENGLPFLTIPVGYATLNNSGLQHEGFHIFQYRANSPGFAYSGDSQWYIEATANWYAATKHPNSKEEYITGSAVTANPQVPMWYSFSNWEPGVPENWQRFCHQYGMNIFLNYLTDVRGVSKELIVGGFYKGLTQLPQEYLYKQIGPSDFCDLYADFAGHNVGGYEFFPSGTEARAQKELNDYGDPADIHAIVRTFTNSGTEGDWYRPSQDYVTRGWGYNVYKIINTQDGYYTFELQGDSLGSEGAFAEFRGRVVIRTGKTVRHESLEMSGPTHGKKKIHALASDAQVFLIVASTPVCFTGNQTFSYQVNIERSSTDAIRVDPLRMVLEQNFPNPANTSTTIPFELAVASEVTFEILDNTGKRVKEMRNGNLSAGKHLVTLAIDDLSAGNYFLVLKAGRLVQVRKMIKVE